ncbi:MAG: D-3-phosphoglycerate dehydrogenase [Desulfovibrio sp.]
MRVLVTETIHEKGMALLRENFDVVEGGNTHDEDTICALIHDCDAVLIRTAKITRRVIEAAPNLRCIAKHGVGVDNVDIVAASERGVAVVNAPFSNCNAVAEHCLGFMLAMLRQTVHADGEIRKGNYVALRAGTKLSELTGKSVGFVGVGRIAQRIVELLAPFAVRVLAYDPYATPETFAKIGARRCENLEAMLAEADIVTIHVPLTPETKNLFGAATLGSMKKGAYLVDAARGGIVDEKAAVAALESGHLAGAAFDVFVTEPPLQESTLVGCSKTLLSPHSAALTVEALENMAVQAAENLTAVLQNREPSSCVNKAALVK